ncbi:hypothetical protein DXG03_004290 [Asterophora parasitica]|uniref:Uncharacterized protein n=1 Tax=Asterophora parasitica TaxID=117018 RepID=A0A9P7FVS4_9AGAR|nr:hypothetical protein DXG03_004290 [Asterophora parasitica]
MHDWSVVQIDNDKIDWDEFQGNTLFVGGNKTSTDWTNYMYPQVNDLHGNRIHKDMLFPLKDYDPEAELHNPQNLDIHNIKTLLAVKNGRTTGTTFGRDTLELIVCGYDTKTGDNVKFSDEGDSGSFVVGRDGRLIGQVTGGGGPTDKTDKSYITPYYALKETVNKKFPGCHPLVLDA